jgi:hypothetical protein
MIYEMRTYALKPRTVPDFEERFGKSMANRKKYSPLAALWHTEFGPLNQVIHVWPYKDLAERAQVRAESVKEDDWPPPVADLELDQESDILIPAPFMRDLVGEEQHLGNIYEMRIYTYPPASIPEVIKAWTEAIPHREKYSPLAACWYTDLGPLNKWIHVWPYKDMAERDRIRAESQKDPNWPPKTSVAPVRQENKILIPAACSPLK